MIYNIIELLWGVSQIVLNWDSSARNNEKTGVYPALFKTLNAPFAVPPVAKTSSKIKTFLIIFHHKKQLPQLIILYIY